MKVIVDGLLSNLLCEHFSRLGVQSILSQCWIWMIQSEVDMLQYAPFQKNSFLWYVRIPNVIKGILFEFSRRRSTRLSKGPLECWALLWLELQWLLVRIEVEKSVRFVRTGPFFCGKGGV